MERSWTWTKPSLTDVVFMLLIAGLLAWSMVSGGFSFRAMIHGCVVALAILCVTRPTKSGERSRLTVLLFVMLITLGAVLQSIGW